MKEVYLAAKRSKTRRFYALYDKLLRPDSPEEALELVIANRGSPGVDNEHIEDIIARQGGCPLEIHELLKAGRYHPRKVKHIDIQKPDGRKRPGLSETVPEKPYDESGAEIIQ